YDDNGKPITYIQSLIDMQDEYFNMVQAHAINYDEFEVPEDFIMDRKKKSMSKELRSTTIPIKLMGGYSKQRVTLEKLFDYNSPIFYGNQKDEDKLNEAYKLFGILFNEDITTNYSDY